jgi:hypothetical protein
MTKWLRKFDSLFNVCGWLIDWLISWLVHVHSPHTHMNQLVNKARTLVSADKFRFTKDGFNLDLVYITARIIGIYSLFVLFFLLNKHNFCISLI